MRGLARVLAASPPPLAKHDATQECERLPPAAIFFLSWQAGRTVGSSEGDMSDYSTVPPPSSGAPGGGGGGGGAVNDAFKDALQRARQVCITSAEGIFFSPPTGFSDFQAGRWLLSFTPRLLSQRGDNPRPAAIAEPFRVAPLKGWGGLWEAFFIPGLGAGFGPIATYKKARRPTNRLVSIMFPLCGGRRRKRKRVRLRFK